MDCQLHTSSRNPTHAKLLTKMTIKDVQRAMEVYTSSGIKGDQHPTYRILSILYEKLRERHQFGVYKQLVDIVLKQIQGKLDNIKMK